MIVVQQGPATSSTHMKHVEFRVEYGRNLMKQLEQRPGRKQSANSHLFIVGFWVSASLRRIFEFIANGHLAGLALNALGDVHIVVRGIQLQ